ncbi:hypothetical protein AB0B42_00675 [Streptomyces fradiae]|uniref:hypothetical protein n=1 Tax=Streptomyces fradiae TaxID=1906 RepID=UPI0033E77028
MGGPLRKYRYRGTVLKLTSQDAQRLGLGEDDVLGQAPPVETVELPDDEPEAKAGTAPNKARAAAANKGGRRRRTETPPSTTVVTTHGTPTTGAAGSGAVAGDSTGTDGGPGGAG